MKNAVPKRNTTTRIYALSTHSFFFEMSYVYSDEKSVISELKEYVLNYTLWPFWVDTHITRPIKKNRNGKIVDGTGSEVTTYPDVPNILESLQSEGYVMGVASRTEWPDGARQLLDLLDWNKYFEYKEIFPGRKTTHFQRMHDKSGIPYSDMIFFDDEQRNITDVRQLGVTGIVVPNGLTNKLLQQSLQQFARR